MPSAASPGGDPLTLVVADRHFLFADGLGRALRQRPGLTVVQTHPSAGARAVEAVLDVQPDVALLDLWLEGVTAVAAAHSLAGAAPQVAVLVLGWRHGGEQIAQALAAGAAGFVSKDVGVEGLVTAIRRAVDGQFLVVDPRLGDVTSGDSRRQPAEVEPRSALREPLTVRELEVLALLGRGLPVEDIATLLTVTRNTAQTHIGRVLEKMGARSQLQAVAAARHAGHLA